MGFSTIYIFVCLIIFFRPLTPYNKVIRQPKCIYMADVGPCKDSIKVYGYDYVTNRCVHYFYGGCGGNPNRFNTKKECMDECYVPDEDSVPDDESVFENMHKNEL